MASKRAVWLVSGHFDRLMALQFDVADCAPLFDLLRRSIASDSHSLITLGR